MPENDLVPELMVSDFQKSLHFYTMIVGFEIEFDRPEDEFAYLRLHKNELMIEQDRDSSSPWRIDPLDYPRGRGLNISMYHHDVDALSERLIDAGYPLQKPIEDKWYRDHDILHGERNFLVQDPDGFLLRFAQDLGTKPVE